MTRIPEILGSGPAGGLIYNWNLAEFQEKFESFNLAGSTFPVSICNKDTYAAGSLISPLVDGWMESNDDDDECVGV